ncbi:hypothetical protein [Neptuniibacter sp. QD37_11]|uniref:hypothetical protein n=1 Tax=Neptuniibacter sp. QD37_11 TaxID=3398209 RepID=UPI0039F45993
MALTIKDRRMLAYYLAEKKDPTQWVSFQEKLADIRAEYPQLFEIMAALEQAKADLSALVEVVKDDVDALESEQDG